jgi:hypothetical protein
MPRALAVPGMWAREALGRALGQPPFERLWMADYIDMKLNVDSTRTRERLGWEPHPRLRILGRIPFMIENLKNDPLEWHRRNREVMEHHTLRSNVVLYRLLEHHAEAVVERLDADLAGRGEGPRLPGFERLGPDERRWQARLLVRNLIQSVQSGEKVPFMRYCRELAEHRARAGADVAEPVGALRALDRAARAALAEDPAARPLGAAIHDLVQMTVEFGIDQVLETFEDARSGDL